MSVIKIIREFINSSKDEGLDELESRLAHKMLKKILFLLMSGELDMYRCILTRNHQLWNMMNRSFKLYDFIRIATQIAYKKATKAFRGIRKILTSVSL